jgi:hypothetical protein
MLDYARLTPGPGFRPLAAACYYSQRIVTNRLARRLVAGTIATGISLRHPFDLNHSTSPWGETLDELRQEGVVRLAETFSAADITQLRAYLEDKEVVGSDGRRFRADRPPPGTTMAAYPLATVLGYAPILDLINRPDLLRLIASYLGCKPTISSIGVRWSFPGSREGSDVQHFHRDPDDWRFLKFFVYLTDVDEASGPHVFVRGTHRTGGQLRARTYDAAEIERSYGKDRIATVIGPRGTSFIADTYGIHQGAPPQQRSRLILQVQYSLLPIYAFIYRPQSLPATAGRDLDPYVNRLILAGERSS